MTTRKPAAMTSVGISPPKREDALAEADVATLEYLIQTGTGRNTIRAMRSDLEYIEAWSLICDGGELAWPPTRDVILRFVAHHLWDPAERERNPDHGMPPHVAGGLRRGGYLRSTGPHAPFTFRRRLSTWRSICKIKTSEDPFADAVDSRSVSSTFRASGRPRVRQSEKAVTLNIAKRLMEHLSRDCDTGILNNGRGSRQHLAALRDRAMLAVAFA